MTYPVTESYDLENQSLAGEDQNSTGCQLSIPLGDSAESSVSTQAVANLASNLASVSTWATRSEPYAKGLQRYVIPALAIGANALASVGQYSGNSTLSMGAAGMLNTAYLFRARTQFVMQAALKHWQGETNDMSTAEKITYFARIVREIGAANSLFILSLDQNKQTDIINGFVIGVALVSALAEEGTNTVKNLHQRAQLVEAAIKQRESLIENLVQAATRGEHQQSLDLEKIKGQIAGIVEQHYPVNESFRDHNQALKKALLTTLSLMMGAAITGVTGVIVNSQNAKSIGTLSTGALFQSLAFLRPLITRESHALLQEERDLRQLNARIMAGDASVISSSISEDSWLQLIQTMRADIVESQQLADSTLQLLKDNVVGLHEGIVKQLEPVQSVAQYAKQIGTQVRLGPGVDSVFLNYADQRSAANYVVSVFSKAALLWTSTGDPLVDAQLHDEKKKMILSSSRT